MVNVYYFYTFYKKATEPKKHMNRDFDLILQQKPLFAMLFIIGTSMSFVIAYLLNTTYFALNSVFNGELILLLDSFSNQKWNSSKCSIRMFALMVIVHKCIFFLTIIELTIEIMSNETFLEFLNFYFVFFTLNTNANISFILTHFTQYGTLETLNENYYKLITDDISLDKFELELRRLAHVNRRINGILSFPLMCSTIAYTLEMTINLSCMWFGQKIKTSLLQFAIHSFAIAFLEQSIQCRMKQIETFLIDKKRIVPFKLFQTFNRKSKLGVMDDISSINYSDVEMIENAEIRKREIIALHSNKFRLHIFQICYFDWKFILHIFLFALNIAFMVTQTSI